MRMFEQDVLRKHDWLIPAGLLALSVIPMVAGAMRLIQLGSGATVTLESARFVAAPMPVVLHLLSAAIFCVLGAFQFLPSFRHRNPNWHCIAGRILVPCGLVAAFSGLWMTQFYPTGFEAPARFDGPSLYVIRLLAGSAMALFLSLGVAAVLRGDFARHQAWMMRAYALGLGAGTQVFTHLPWFLFPTMQGELARTLCMGAGWAINLAVAEWIILRGSTRRLQNGLVHVNGIPVIASSDRHPLNLSMEMSPLSH
jgi:uncharacterized membrane protein